MPDPTRSQHAERFNHDAQARAYDANVADEANPVRTGYLAALEWVADRCNLAAASHLLELGCGTGNLTSRLRAGEITAVDISPEMMALAKPKLSPEQNVRFVQADVLEFAGTLAPGSVDVVASTYALHHLTEPEKRELIGRLAKALRPNAHLIVADLMFADPAERARTLDAFARAGRAALVDCINDEFYWDAAAAKRWLSDSGLTAEWKQVSTLSWCLHATR